MNSSSPVLWEPPSPKLKLNEDQVHLWRVQINYMSERIGDLDAYLNDKERERGMRFYFNHSRNQFWVSRGSLRVILSQYIDSTPEEIVFITGTGGKPFLKASSITGGLSFNLSHSGEFVLIEPLEMLAEMRVMIQHMEGLTHCVFRTNHASNYLPLAGTLSQDKERLLATLDHALVHLARGESVLRPEYLRAL